MIMTIYIESSTSLSGVILAEQPQIRNDLRETQILNEASCSVHAPTPDTLALEIKEKATPANNWPDCGNLLLLTKRLDWRDLPDMSGSNVPLPHIKSKWYDFCCSGACHSSESIPRIVGEEIY